MRLHFQGLLGAEVLNFAGLLFKALKNANLRRLYFVHTIQGPTCGKHLCME